MPPLAMRSIAIVLAAGEGTRLGSDGPKAFLDVDGVPMLVRAVRAAAESGLVREIVVPVPAGLEPRARELLREIATPVTVIAGGPSRHVSVDAGLSTTPDDVGTVLCHDAARPFAR